MAKYNITEKKEKAAAYRSLVSPRMMDEMQEQIMNIIVMQKNDIGTNTRYISAVVNVRFHMNYSSFVNKYRIEEAMSILVDKRYQDLDMEDVGFKVGFANRQAFYGSFYRFVGITPRQYRMEHLKKHPSMAGSKK